MTEMFQKIEYLTEEIKISLEAKDKQLLFHSVREAQEQLTQMGIVTRHTQNLIEELNELDGFAKVSGAGSIKGKGSGAVICFADDYSKIKEFLNQVGFKYYQLAMSVSGVHSV